MPANVESGLGPRPPTAPVEVDYVPELDDLVAYFLFVEDRRWPPMRRAVMYWLWRFLPLAAVTAVAAVLLFGVVCYILPPVQDEDYPPLALACFLDVLAFVVIATGCFIRGETIEALPRRAALRAARRRAARRAEGYERMRRRVRFRVAQEGFTEIQETESSDEGVCVRRRKETAVSWATVDEIRLIADDLVFVSEKGVWLVPNSACPEDRKWTAFTEAAQAFWRAFSAPAPALASRATGRTL